MDYKDIFVLLIFVVILTIAIWKHRQLIKQEAKIKEQEALGCLGQYEEKAKTAVVSEFDRIKQKL